MGNTGLTKIQKFIPHARVIIFAPIAKTNEFSTNQRAMTETGALMMLRIMISINNIYNIFRYFLKNRHETGFNCT